MWTRAELKARAKVVLKTSYWKAFLVSLIIAVVSGGVGIPGLNWNFGGNKSQNFSNIFGNAGNTTSGIFPAIVLIIVMFMIVLIIFGIAFRILIGYSLEVGGRRYFIQSEQGEVSLNHIGDIFERGKYGDVIKAMLWRALFNILWYLLFFIPGIVKSYAYKMVPYILADNPNIGYKRALNLSKEMTKGQKLEMWVLDLSFIGWYLLGLLALFVGTLFVTPYYNSTQAELYLVLRQDALDRGLCSREELLLSTEPVIRVSLEKKREGEDQR